MEAMIGMLNHYSNLITAASTFVLAVLTTLLLCENRRLRKAGARPEIVAYILPHPDGHGGIQFVLANIGRGPAFQVKFKLVYDGEDFKEHKVYLKNDVERAPIAVLPQDEAIKSLFGISFVLYGRAGEKVVAPLKPFQVEIEYLDIFGTKQVRESNIDIKQFAGLHGVLEKSNHRKMSESLEGVEKSLSKIARQAARFSAFVDTTQIGDQYVTKAKGE